MRKYLYWIADVLTLARFVCCVRLLIGALTGNMSHQGAFIVFVIGELTDAFDGMCARRWPYPNDGKLRWWRTHAEAIDQVADMSLGIIIMLYVTIRISPPIGGGMLIGTLAVGIPAQIYILGLWLLKPVLAERLTMIRRWIYLGLLATVILIMTVAATGVDSWKFWTNVPFMVLLSIEVVVAIVLFIVKWGRATKAKAPKPGQQ
jgi:hypothetical protein